MDRDFIECVQAIALTVGTRTWNVFDIDIISSAINKADAVGALALWCGMARTDTGTPHMIENFKAIHPRIVHRILRAVNEELKGEDISALTPDHPLVRGTALALPPRPRHPRV